MVNLHTPVTLVHLLLVCFIAKHCSLIVRLEYSLSTLPNLQNKDPLTDYRAVELFADLLAHISHT